MLELQFEESPLYEQLLEGAPLSTHGGGLSLERAYGQSLGLDKQLLQAHPYQPVPPGIETQLNR
jgi:galactonate dehydratase